jgi:hypothetical protein
MFGTEYLEGVKVGDYLYTTISYSSNLLKAKVVRETDKTFVLDNDTKVRKSDGCVIGSDSGGRYGFSDITYYSKSTPELKLQFKIQRVKSAVINLGQISPDKLIITTKNMDSFISAINTIRAAVEKEEVK